MSRQRASTFAIKVIASNVIASSTPFDPPRFVMNQPYDDHEPDLQRLRRDPEGMRRSAYYEDDYRDTHGEHSGRRPPAPIASEHRELTLSAGAILGLFFGLVVLCGIFFGLGYNLHGHGTAQSTENGSAVPAAQTNFSAFKPAAGLPAASSATKNLSSTAPIAASGTASKPIAAVQSPESSPIVRAEPPAVSATPSANVLVQVAAISLQHRQDADLLISALKAKGYTAFARADTDNLIHVQVGPFATRAAADAVRSRLQADGYSPYIK